MQFRLASYHASQAAQVPLKLLASASCWDYSQLWHQDQLACFAYFQDVGRGLDRPSAA